MGYASKLGSSYNANTAWSSLGPGLFGGYGARDTARAPYNAQVFRNILNVDESSGYRTKPINFNQYTPEGGISFSSNPMSFSQELKQIPNMVYMPQQMLNELSGRYMNVL